MSWAFHKSIWVHSRLSYTSRNVYTLFRLTAGLWNGSPHTFVTVGYCVSSEPTAYKGRGDSSKCNLRMTRDNSLRLPQGMDSSLFCTDFFFDPPSPSLAPMHVCHEEMSLSGRYYHFRMPCWPRKCRVAGRLRNICGWKGGGGAVKPRDRLTNEYGLVADWNLC